MSNYKSFEDLNETFLPSTSESILLETWNIYRTRIRSFDDYCLLLENSINLPEDRESTLNNIEIHFNKISNEFYNELNLLITSDSNLANPISIKSEIYTLEKIIEDLNDTHKGTIKSESIIEFIQNDCKPLLKIIYSALKERVSNTYLSNESNNNYKITNKTKIKSFFDTDLNLNNDEIFIELRAKLIEKKFIKETHNFTALVNLFQDKNQKIVWTGKKNELILFIMELKEEKIILDDKHWEIALEVFVNKKNEPFDGLKKIYTKDYKNETNRKFIKNIVSNLKTN